MFGRTIDLLGAEAFARLNSSFVVVVGLGGVGSHAAVALARAGIGKLRLIDVDVVTESSLNRHACAVRADVGRQKTAVVRDYLKAIRPDMEVECSETFFHEHSAPELLAGSPDFVLDAIDSLNPKVTLLKYCVQNGIKVVASMGASGRTDPTRLEVADIRHTSKCPLARFVRRRLRRQGVNEGIECVFSTQEAADPLPPQDEEDDNHYWQGRKRNRLPSLSTMPGIFGYACAGIVIRRIAESCGVSLDSVGE